MKTFVLRWNPDISSYKIDDYCNDCEMYVGGFELNWSIFDWKDAHEGDRYIMTRVGDGPNGVVWLGTFLSDPYEDEDWAGTCKKRYYVDIDVCVYSDADDPLINVEELEALIPDVDWRKGHSDQVLHEEQALKLESFFNWM